MTRASTRPPRPGPHTARYRPTSTWHSRFAQHKKLWGTVTLVFAAAAVSLVALWPQHPGPTPPRPVSTVAQNQRACLLADRDQLATSNVLADLQRAATIHGHVNVQQVTLPPQTSDAAPELQSLIQQHCAIVFALGPTSTMAARAAATNTHPSGTRLVTITDSATGSRNLTTLPLTGLTADHINTALQQTLN